MRNFITILELYFLFKITKFVFKTKKNFKNTIVSKTYKIISKKIHAKLDKKLKSSQDKQSLWYMLGGE